MPDNADPRPWGAGTVTRIGAPVLPPPVDPPPPAPPAEQGRERRRLLWFAGVAGGMLVIGLVLVLAFTMSGGVDPFGDKPAGPSDVRPPLARACPAPTGITEPEPVDPGPPPSGARTVDEEAGISYPAYGAPWQPWRTVWSAGTLEVPYKMGQHFVTETYTGGTYHASILSAAVPAADNDAVAINLECVGQQVAADVRAEYYPQPTTMDLHRNERTTLGGRPAWLTVFRLHFSRPGLQAKDEFAGVAVIDVGKPTAAVLYVSIPGTHRQFDYIVDEVFKSVRPT
ncbi:hypothetical protein GCM10022251_09510 [Phytohabitans flavus]|uniref:Uncharacterized protein n=1 Tax=Phytohabitans flavus TaxID=1076124 RepID=A0A6F8Y171_9ACTN|nr:hypothetical protein [Phytohabitans flavus]BCB79854.1 hypothetical protein Pflav_062640 [Phytohabitans flavus]